MSMRFTFKVKKLAEKNQLTVSNAWQFKIMIQLAYVYCKCVVKLPMLTP